KSVSRNTVFRPQARRLTGEDSSKSRLRNKIELKFWCQTMTKIRLVRDSGYADRLRAYVLLVDGNNVCELRNGEVQEVCVAPGQRSLSARIDWCGSKPLQFAAPEDGTLSFIVKSNLRGWRILLGLFYALCAPKSYIRIKQEEA